MTCKRPRDVACPSARRADPAVSHPAPAVTAGLLSPSQEHTMRRCITLLAVALVACADASGPTEPDALAPAMTATSLTSSQVVNFGAAAFVACALDGAGETVTISGSLHVVSHTTVNDAGHVLIMTHFQPQGITGTGSVSGDRYRATGVTRSTFRGRVGESDTYVNNFLLIGPGPNNNYTVHETFHFTINANGELTVVTGDLRIDCG